MRRSANGFTLIELMIVVSIIGILAAIAIPNYKDYLIKSKITHATSNLANKRIQIEQFYQDNRTYVGSTGCVADTTTSPYFDFSCTAATATTYTLEADGKGPMLGFTYTVNQDNVKVTTVGAGAPSGWAGNAACWVTGKGGTC